MDKNELDKKGVYLMGYYAKIKEIAGF